MKLGEVFNKFYFFGGISPPTTTTTNVEKEDEEKVDMSLRQTAARASLQFHSLMSATSNSLSTLGSSLISKLPHSVLAPFLLPKTLVLPSIHYKKFLVKLHESPILLQELSKYVFNDW